MATIKRYTLTTDEANTLLALGTGHGTLPEVVVGTRLAPSEVRETLDSLVSKELIAHEQNEQSLRLTDAGRDAYHEMTYKSPYQSSHGSGRYDVRVSVTEVTPAESHSIGEFRDEDELDEAIDLELAKLSE